MTGTRQLFPRPPRIKIECGSELNNRIRGHLHNALAGKPVLFGDSLWDLIKRHCPEIYEMCAVEGFRFEANKNPEYLEIKPPHGPQFYFNICRAATPRLN